jgi:hypothetical protein
VCLDVCISARYKNCRWRMDIFNGIKGPKEFPEMENYTATQLSTILPYTLLSAFTSTATPCPSPSRACEHQLIYIIVIVNSIAAKNLHPTHDAKIPAQHNPAAFSFVNQSISQSSKTLLLPNHAYNLIQSAGISCKINCAHAREGRENYRAWEEEKE